MHSCVICLEIAITIHISFSPPNTATKMDFFYAALDSLIA